MLQKPTYKWYAVYTRPHNEKKVCSWLKENNIECYLPLKSSLRQWSDRKKWIEEPLFRSYIFVRVSYIEYFNVLSIPGVIKYVSFGGQPQAIPDNQIEYIKIIVQQRDQEIEVNYKNIRKGSECEVLFGPLKGIRGEVVRISGQSRLVIRLASMGVSLQVNISRDEIKPIKNQKQITQQNKYSSLNNIPYRKAQRVGNN